MLPKIIVPVLGLLLFSQTIFAQTGTSISGFGSRALSSPISSPISTPKLSPTPTPVNTLNNASGTVKNTPAPTPGSTPKSTPTPSPTSSPTSINQMIQQAKEGDTIRIHKGVYKEQVEVNKKVNLQPFGDGEAVIDGECKRDVGILFVRSGASVSGLTIKNTIDQGILIKGGISNISIDKMIIQDFDCRNQGGQQRAGIAAYYSGSNIKITGNTINDRVNVSKPDKVTNDCIWFKSNDASPSGGGHYIAGNFTNGCKDGIGGENEGSDHGSFDKNTAIENNVVKNCADDGIQIEGGDVNITVQNNRIENCLIGIAFAPNRIGPLYIKNNSILADGSRGSTACYKVGRKGNGTTYLTGNDCQAKNGTDGIKQTNSSLAPIVSSGNNYQTSRYIFELKDTPAGPSKFDGDCIYTTDKSRFIKWGSRRILNFEDFKAKTGQEKKGINSQNCSNKQTQVPQVESVKAELTKTEAREQPPKNPVINFLNWIKSLIKF